MAFGQRTGDRSAARGSGAMSPFFLGSNILIWLSAIIVMGLTAFFVSEAHELGREATNHVLYILVIVSVPTVLIYCKHIGGKPRFLFFRWMGKTESS